MSSIRLLSKIAQKTSRTIIGVLSGTSVDSTHVAICSIKGAGIQNASIKLRHLVEVPYNPRLRKAVRAASSLNIQEIAELHVQLGQMFGEAVMTALRKAKIKPSQIDLIGSHGQTVYHHSSRKGSIPATLQIGDGDQIAEITGISVFSDFRTRDIAAGGEGAPLTPYADAVMFRQPSGFGKRLVLNLGGVANVTVLDKNAARIIGYDTAPANGPLDRLAVVLSKGRLRYDKNGRIAHNGKARQEIVEKLLRDDAYLKKAPPKSTGFEMYGDEFVAKLIRLHGKASADVLATATEFCARATADSLHRFIARNLRGYEIVLAGGGARNPVLVAALKKYCAPAKIILSDTLGVPCEAREAMAFALFANDALCGVSTSLPSVTGARAPRLLGKLSLGN